MIEATHIKESCLAEGFLDVAIAPAQAAPTFPQFRAWVSSGLHGQMGYLADHRADLRRSILEIHPEAKSVVMVLWSYADSDVNGPVAAYAKNAPDYHHAIKMRLSNVLKHLQSSSPELCGVIFADTHPILERDYAQLAGLGWIGKNTVLISRQHGSLFTLGGMTLSHMVDQYDLPTHKSFCGTCTRCLDQCPTHAFVAPHVLDARRCISYLTIEYRGVIGAEFIPHLKGHFYGCDICQQICPWNQKQVGVSEDEPFDPLVWLHMSQKEFESCVSATAMTRMKYDMMQRNALIQVFHQYGMVRAQQEVKKMQCTTGLVIQQLSVLEEM